MVKISLAKTSGSLDLSWLGLEDVPDEIFELPDLEVSGEDLLQSFSFPRFNAEAVMPIQAFRLNATNH